jgi:hypothetical protein
LAVIAALAFFISTALKEQNDGSVFQVQLGVVFQPQGRDRLSGRFSPQSGLKPKQHTFCGCVANPPFMWWYYEQKCTGFPSRVIHVLFTRA